MTNNFFDESVVLGKLHEYEEQVNEELSKDNINREKIMKLRYEQLLKGMFMTQDPNYSI